MSPLNVGAKTPPSSFVLAAVLTGILSGPGAARAEQALRLAAPGDYAEVPHAAALSPQRFTLELWVRVHDVGDPALAGGEQTLVDKRSGQDGYNLRIVGTEFPLGVAIDANPEIAVASDVIDFAIWHHVAATQDGTTLRLFVDGREAATVENPDYRGQSTSVLRLGEFLGFPGTSLRLRGDLDEVRIWNRARSGEDIAADANRELSGQEQGLVGHWTFDDDSAALVEDSAGDNHGRLLGAAELIPSPFPHDLDLLPTPVGARAVTAEGGIEVRWRGTEDPEVQGYEILRNVPPGSAPGDGGYSLIASVAAPATSYVAISAEAGEGYLYRVRAVGARSSSRSSVPALGRMAELHDDYSVGVYYYPWWGPDWHVWPGRYTRDFLTVEQPPLLGHYSRTDSAVIRQHLDWMTQYDIDFLVSSWWGRQGMEDLALLDNLLPELDGRAIRFTVYYELLLLGPLNDEAYMVIDAEKRKLLVDDFVYLADTYFDHPNFLRIDDRPVVFLYLSRTLAGDFEAAFAAVRKALEARGYDLFLIGDEIGPLIPDLAHLQFLDGISPYISLQGDSYPGYPLDAAYYADLSRWIGAWQRASQSEGKLFIPNAYPGFNDRGIHLDLTRAVPRQSTSVAEGGSALTEMIRLMRSFVDSEHKMLMITSWNEWHEDTQIEPTVVGPPTSLDSSASGDLYTEGYEYEGYGTKYLEIVEETLRPGEAGPCVAGPTALCLNGGRFRVEVEWRDFEGNLGSGRVVPFGSDDSGLFWFFEEANWEMLVKVLDGSTANRHFWVFSAATTNLEYTLRVTDTQTGATKSYFNRLGLSAPAITDTQAFALDGKGLAPNRLAPRQWLRPKQTAASSACQPSATSVCLNGGQFRVEVEWGDFTGTRGPGRVVPIGSDDSALFWFFDRDNWEMLVKVLDGCDTNGHFWVFSAATTNVDYSLRVTDTETGQSLDYTNPLGRASPAITDTGAFAACP